MLGSTFVIPRSGGNVTCNLINQDGYSAEYLAKVTGGEFWVRVRHSTVKATATRPAMDRHNVEITEIVYADGDVAQFDRKTYLVFECKPDDTAADVVMNVDALADWLIASTNANVTKLIGWES